LFDFLRSETRKKIVRTTLYGDQEFTLWEMEMLHTPLVQRLYDLKQLGLADRVFPDAVHSRFNHVLGVAEVSGRMADQLVDWLDRHRDQVFAYASDRPESGHHQLLEIKGDALAELVRKRRPVIRLLALLHDITHAAFGHTLEDEVRVFAEKHDDPARQIRFFNALTAQLVYMWCTRARVRDVDPLVLDRLTGLTLGAVEFRGWVEELAAFLDNVTSENESRQALAQKLRELETAFRLLLRLEFIHEEHRARPVPEPEHLYVSDAIEILYSSIEELDLVLHRDAFMIDMVGNTICADLLDYGRRDSANAGLKVQFDERRLIRYLTVVSVEGDLSPTHDRCLRIALQFFTDKMRHDVLSEMSGVLKARYVINERVLFHPTKCAAGALLGTAVQLVGMQELPAWVQVLGDQEFLAELTRIAAYLSLFCSSYRPGEDYVLALTSLWGTAPHVAELLQKCIQGISGTPSHSLTETQRDQVAARASAARRLCWKLNSRRFPKLAFRLRTGVQHSGGATHETIAEEFAKPEARFDLERRVERRCRLPVGAVVIHCPRWRTSMKLAEVLVVGGDLGRVAKLRNLTRISPEGLLPYESEITAIEEMYKSIWQFHVFLEDAWFERQPVVSWILEDELGFPNDRLLTEELEHEPGSESLFRILSTDLKGDVALNRLTDILTEVDARLAGLRNRHEKIPTDKRDWLRQIIGTVSAAAGSYKQKRLPLKTEGEKSK
jgi:HD superfamily phosphohydrolase